MYIPSWLIVVIVIAIIIYFTRKRKVATPSVEGIERGIAIMKRRVFDLEHFDSPHFVDVQDAFTAMEINYLRLKQRFSNEPQKVLEIANDWDRYVGALGDLKFARTMLDVDMEEGASETFEERSKEPWVIKEEVEKKFSSLLEKDFTKVPPDYFHRLEEARGKKKEAAEGIEHDGWMVLYQDSPNLWRMKDLRKKRKKEMEESAKTKEASKK